MRNGGAWARRSWRARCPETTTPRQGNGCALGSLGGYDHQGARLELRYLASDDLEINFDADYSKQADDPPLQALLTPYGGAGDTTNIAYNNAVVHAQVRRVLHVRQPLQFAAACGTTTRLSAMWLRGSSTTRRSA